jgi:uncharacterized protein YutE (UPF0331/DUF86 family)
MDLRNSNLFNGVISEEKLNKLTLEAIILLMFGSGIINQTTYCKSMEIKEKRNALVHKPWANLTLDETEARHLLEKAIECLENIGVVI